jgi:hypothetical protein
MAANSVCLSHILPALASDPDKLRRLDDVIKDLGVEG